MRHQELKNHIKGSILKEQYLEAFLVQGAYIEGLLKLYIDFEFFCVTQDQPNNKMIKVLRDKASKYGLFEQIDFLFKSELITKEERDLLDKNREKRNKVLHDLLDKIKDDDFEVELREACEMGEKIINSKNFISMSTMVDAIEEKMDKVHDKETKIDKS